MSRARAALREPSQGTAGALQARSLLEDSVRHDDRSAETWAMLATTYLNNVRFSASREFEIERAGQAVQRALALGQRRGPPGRGQVVLRTETHAAGADRS